MRLFRRRGARTPTISREEAHRRFVRHAVRIWQPSDPEFITRGQILSPEEPAKGVFASLAVPTRAKPMTRYGRIFRRAPTYKLRLSSRLLEESETVIESILIHEAVHVGILTHTREFREIVRQHGGAITEMAALGGGIKIQRQPKPRARYQTIHEFGPEVSESAAYAWMVAEHARTPGRYRMEM